MDKLEEEAGDRTLKVNPNWTKNDRISDDG